MIQWIDTKGRRWSPLKHQEQSRLRWLENGYKLRCLHETGTGKTFVFLFCYLSLYFMQKKFPKGLIVCTRTLEKTTWTPLLKLWGLDKHLIAETYQKIHNDPDILKDIEFIAIDEDHYLSSYKGKMTKTFLLYTRHIPYKILGTGTPEPRGLSDWFFSIKFLTGIYDSADKWIRSWGGWYKIEIYQYVCKKENFDKMLYYYAPLLDTVKLENVEELPKVHDHFIEMELSPEQQEAYDSFGYRNEFQLHALNPLTEGIILRMICSDVLTENVPEEPSPGVLKYEVKKIWKSKINKIKELCKTCDKPIIIWSRFRNFSEKLYEILSEKYSVQLWAGGTEKDLEKFNRGETEIIVASHQSVAEGVNLQKSHVAIFVHPDFDVTKYLQARHRIYRIGQESEVHYYHLIYKNTIEEKVWRAVNVKERRQNKTINFIAKTEVNKVKRKLLSTET